MIAMSFFVFIFLLCQFRTTTSRVLSYVGHPQWGFIHDKSRASSIEECYNAVKDFHKNTAAAFHSRFRKCYTVSLAAAVIQWTHAIEVNINRVMMKDNLWVTGVPDSNASYVSPYIKILWLLDTVS